MNPRRMAASEKASAEPKRPPDSISWYDIMRFGVFLNFSLAGRDLQGKNLKLSFFIHYFLSMYLRFYQTFYQDSSENWTLNHSVIFVILVMLRLSADCWYFSAGAEAEMHAYASSGFRIFAVLFQRISWDAEIQVSTTTSDDFSVPGLCSVHEFICFTNRTKSQTSEL